jgi:thymidine phosphorylase
LELMDVLDVLTTGKQGRLFDLVVALGSDVLVQGGLYETVGHAKSMISQSITGGDAAEVFGRMIADLGGPRDFVDQYGDRLAAAPVVMDIMPTMAGRVVGMDGRALGMAVVHLGGGRLREGDVIDASVGLTHVANIGEAVDEYTPLARVHAQSPSMASRAADQVRAAFDIGDGAFQTQTLIHKRITP